MFTLASALGLRRLMSRCLAGDLMLPAFVGLASVTSGDMLIMRSTMNLPHVTLIKRHGKRFSTCEMLLHVSMP